jgi:hypothetical protein
MKFFGYPDFVTENLYCSAQCRWRTFCVQSELLVSAMTCRSDFFSIAAIEPEPEPSAEAKTGQL